MQGPKEQNIWSKHFKFFGFFALQTIFTARQITVGLQAYEHR